MRSQSNALISAQSKAGKSGNQTERLVTPFTWPQGMRKLPPRVDKSNAHSPYVPMLELLTPSTSA